MADGVALRVSYLHIPELGEQGIYFVESLSRPLVNPLVGWHQGHYLVDREQGTSRSMVRTLDGKPVFGLEPAGAQGISRGGGAAGVEVRPRKPLEMPMTPDDFKARIRGMLQSSESSISCKRVFDLVKDFGTSESPKSTRSSTTHWCPGRPGHPAFRHNIASSLRLHTGLPYDWTPRSDAPLGSPLAPSARRVSRVASRLPGTTRLRFALHGGQRTPRDYYFVTRGTPQKIGKAEKTSLSKSHAYTQKGRYRVPRGKVAYLKVLLAKIIVNPFAQTDQERVLYDYTVDPVNGLPEDHYVHIAGVTVDYERDSPYVFTGNVPGWGDVCADTRSGDFWINGIEQWWTPVYEENYSAYECPDRFNNESCGDTNHTVYTVDGSPTKNVCQAYDPLFPRVCTRSTVMYKTVVGHTSRMPNTTSISYSEYCWADDTGMSCSTATIRNIIDGPLHGVFRENQRWSSRIKLSNNDLHYFLLNLDSITLKHNTYDGLQEIDPPGVIPETLTMRFINIPAPMFVPWEVTSERTLGRASLVTWSSDGKNSQTSQILQ